jgi:hypothetical protein
MRLRDGHRVFLLMLALGVASVPFFTGLYRTWAIDTINIPQTESPGPIVVIPTYPGKTPVVASGSGPDGSNDPLLTQKILQKVTLAGAEMSGTDLTQAEISEVDFGSAVLNQVKFSKAVILYSGFVGADLHNTDFAQARVVGSDFTNAKFKNINFVRANLSASDFSNTSFSTVDITDANLSDARLENARELTYKQLKNAVINRFTTLPPYLADHRDELLQSSLKKAVNLKKEMSPEQQEMYFNQFDFLFD